MNSQSNSYLDLTYSSDDDIEVYSVPKISKIGLLSPNSEGDWNSSLEEARTIYSPFIPNANAMVSQSERADRADNNLWLGEEVEQKYSEGNTGILLSTVPDSIVINHAAVVVARPDFGVPNPQLSDGKKYRQWLVTYYEKPIFAPTWMKYLLAGEELCPTTGKMHWQSHVTSKNPIDIKNMRKKVSPWHCEPVKFLQKHLDYCKKDNKWEEFGDKPGQGARNDLVEIMAELKSGETNCDDLMFTQPELYWKYERIFIKAEDHFALNQKRSFEMGIKVYWYWGPTGTGKSRRVHELEPDCYVYPYEQNKWWDGYHGQSAVLFDDYRANLPFNELLRIIDCHPYAVARRCRQPRPLMAVRFYFTSSKPPQEVYSGEISAVAENINQLERRITEIHHMEGHDLGSFYKRQRRL